MHALTSHAMPADPRNFAEAMASSQAQQWREAMQDECQSIMDNKVLELVPRDSLPADARPLASMFIFKTKHDANGNVERHKARMVVKGCAQRQGVDYDEVFAPVAHHESIRIVLSTAAARGMVVHQMDVKTAFLIPEIKEVIFMELPRGWPEELPGGGSNGTLVARLNKALYGLKQAPRYWYERLSGWMVDEGFKRSQSDPCLFVRELGDHNYLYVTVWVDDLLIAAAREQDVLAFKRRISAAFSMKDLGVAHFCLGMRFRYGWAAMDQERYIGELLERHGMANCKPVQTVKVWQCLPLAHQVAPCTCSVS